jgi:hypothetical protein
MLSLDMAAKVAGYPGPLCPDYSFGAAVAAHGRAVYVSAEDDEPEIHRRLWSLCGGRHARPAACAQSAGRGALRHHRSRPHTKEFKPTEAWRDLVTEIRELPDVKLIVLDTLQALTTGDTNTVEATQPLMNEATALASATGACVLLVHHVAKGSTKEIKTALDAMEAIRGSGAIAGTARAAYVMWPPADGGKKECDVLGEPIRGGQGCIRHRGEEIRRRPPRPIPYSCATTAASCKTGRSSTTRFLAPTTATRCAPICCKPSATSGRIGQAFATSNGGNGLHARRFELAEAFHEKTRAWFDEQAGKMLADGSIKRLTYKGGSRYVPPEAESAIPKAAPEGQAEREGDTPEAEETAPEMAA